MKCPVCNKEMRKGYVFSTKDGALSFANEVPSAFKNAEKSDGFIKLSDLKVGGRTSVKAEICEDCKKIVISYTNL